MNYNDETAEITLTGLTAGQPYRFRLYNRQWGAGDRGQDIGFDTDGVGTDINGAEFTGVFYADDATRPDPSFATATQVNALTFDYTLSSGVTTLKVYINKKNTGTYHMYGLTNEEAGPDTTPPTIDEMKPADDATGIYPAANLVAIFSEDIALVTNGTVTIKNLTAPSQVVITLMDSQVTVSGSDLTIDPSANLAFNTLYAIQISTNAVEDLADTPNSFGGITNDTTWSFATVAQDLSAPVITTTAPTNNATGVLPDANLVAEFDQNIVAGSGNITISNLTELTTLMTISITNTAQISIVGNVLTINPSGLLAGGSELAVLIDAGAVKNYSDVDFAGISDATTWSFNVASETTYLKIGTTSNSDTWNVPANWDIAVPSGALSPIIPAGKYATVWSASTPTYTGDLSIGSGVTLQIGWTTIYSACWNVIGTAGSTTITMGDGAFIKSRTSGSPNIPAIQLLGNAKFGCGESTQTPASPKFGQPISGAHTFTLQSNASGPTIQMNASNSFSELVITAISGRGGSHGTVQANVPNSFGAGDVTLVPVGDLALKLEFNSTNAMASAGTLNVNGKGPAGDGANRVQMDADNTVGALNIQGFPFPAGTYSRVGTPASVDYEADWIAGDSVLMVAGEPVDPSAPELVDITSDSGNGIHYYKLEPVTYTLTFNEAVTSAVTTVDFDNAGTAAVSIDSVVQTDLNVFKVVVTASSTGTLILRIKSSASFHDLFGNTLTGPITDDTTNMVVELPPTSLLYEPFDYATGGISGENGGAGFAGPWASHKNNPNVDPQSKYWGSLLTLGNHIRGAAWSNCSRPIGTTISNAGLMANGATLWFAVIFDFEKQNTTNADLNMGLTTDIFVPGDYGNKQNLEAGEGIGVTHSRAMIQGAYWQNNDADAIAERTTANSSITLNSTDNARVLLVGKIEWGADDLAGETLTLYAPDEELVMGSPILNPWTTAALDQSQFDLVALEFKDTPKMDEIRFGATYDEVIGIALPAAGTLIFIK